MRFNLAGMNLAKILKLVIPTIVFYAIGISIMTYCNKVSPGGPCAPGGGFLAFLLFIPVVFILLLRNIILAIRKDKQYGIVAILHAVILIACFLFL